MTSRGTPSAGVRTIAPETIRFARVADLIVLAADAPVDVARLLQLAGRGREAASMANQAADAFERNGNPGLAARARRLAVESSPAWGASTCSRAAGPTHRLGRRDEI